MEHETKTQSGHLKGERLAPELLSCFVVVRFCCVAQASPELPGLLKSLSHRQLWCKCGARDAVGSSHPPISLCVCWHRLPLSHLTPICHVHHPPSSSWAIMMSPASARDCAPPIGTCGDCSLGLEFPVSFQPHLKQPAMVGGCHAGQCGVSTSLHLPRKPLHKTILGHLCPN